LAESFAPTGPSFSESFLCVFLLCAMLPKFLDTGGDMKRKLRGFGKCRQELQDIADAEVVFDGISERCTTSRNAIQVAALLGIIVDNEPDLWLSKTDCDCN
jgi:hypothetical protein